MFYHLTSGTAMLGILIAIPLMLMWRTRPSNGWLGLFLASISMVSMTEFFADDATMFGVFDWPTAAFGPLYYTYVISVIGRRLRPSHAWHAAPFVAYCGVLFVVRLDMLGYLQVGPAMAPIYGAAFLAAQILCFGYLLAVFRLLRQHRRHVRDYFSSTASRALTWLTWLTVVLLAVFVLWIVTSQFDRRAVFPLAVGRLAVLYFVAWFGSRQVAVFQAGHPAEAALPAALPPQVVALPPDPVASPPDSAASPPDSAALPPNPAALPVAPVSTPVPPREKYARSGMTDAARDLIGQRLRRRMQEQHDYLDHDITLATLAGHIGALPHMVSQYLNEDLQISFFDYVNGYRIAAVERKMVDPATCGMTLLDMALTCGFNSKSTFNAAFKRVHGMSPSAWRSARTASAPVLDP